MSNQVKAIPDGLHSLTPYLTLDNASDAIEFYKKAFGAHEIFRMLGPDQKIAHAEIQIGDSRVMLADESRQMGTESPKTLGGSPAGLMLYVEKVDDVCHQAVHAGAKVTRELKDQFYGDRTASLEDPFGHKWIISTHIEDVTPEEVEKRMKEMMTAQAGSR